MKRECKNCSNRNDCQDSFTAWLFFTIGIIAAIAIRLVAFLMELNPVYAKISWYIGVLGFFLFFFYKFKLLNARNLKIKKQNILEKIERRELLEEKDYRVIKVILCNISSSKERINYLFIFALSAIALILAIYIDL